LAREVREFVNVDICAVKARDSRRELLAVNVVPSAEIAVKSTTKVAIATRNVFLILQRSKVWLF
jgi:hypothetical protein